MFKKSLAAVAVLGMAACSGGGGIVNDEIVEVEPELGFQERLAAAPVTLSGDLPISGDAEFNGIFQVAVGIDVDNPQSAAVGDAQLNVDFANNSLSGSASNFIDQDGDAVTGTVGFDNGIIGRDQANATVTTDTSGSINLDTGATAFDQQLTGGFFGPTGDIIQGVTVTSTQIGEDVVPVVGVLQVEQ